MFKYRKSVWIRWSDRSDLHTPFIEFMTRNDICPIRTITFGGGTFDCIYEEKDAILVKDWLESQSLVAETE